jgi:23S rRNA U2552 (ribose-2'-O)-methylase RlmE/FtsJ
MSNGFLHKYFLNNSYLPMHKWVHYFDIYERHLERFRGTAPVMIEIGVAAGGSLAMWKEYFGSGSHIIGIDINPECKAYEGDGIDIFIGSQDDPTTIDAIFSKHPKIDIVLDDGSHIMHHMISSFELMYDRIHSNGVYIVEDIHTCYWEEFGGGLGREGSFMEFAKQKLDEINAVHTRGILPNTEFTRSTDHVSFYDSVVVFERRRQGQRKNLVTHVML